MRARFRSPILGGKWRRKLKGRNQLPHFPLCVPWSEEDDVRDEDVISMQSTTCPNLTPEATPTDSKQLGTTFAEYLTSLKSTIYISNAFHVDFNLGIQERACVTDDWEC